MVERCCAMAERLTLGIGELPGAEIIARPLINQGLVRFLAIDGDHDARTEAVVQRIQAEGTAWFGSTTWRGMRVMRISVCNWRTDEQDVERTIAAVHQALTEVCGG
jgi:glutamate/tyrosine decarboxylase-like PLP-dependent enzyme